MTNAQKWVAAFLVLFIVLFALGKLTQKDDIVIEDDNYYSDSGENTQTGELSGLDLMKRSGCVSCHGSELQGTQVGPALVSLKEYWSRDNLINYLRNPSSYSGDERFDRYRSTYKNVIMPSYSNIDVKDLGKIADYLLTK